MIRKILWPGSKTRQKKQAEKVRAGFWRTVQRAAGRIPFMENVVAAYFCAFDPMTPLHVRLTLIAALAYFVSPVDMIPDMLAVIGFTDDVAVLAAALAAVRSHLTEAHVQAAREFLGYKISGKGYGNADQKPV